MEQGWVRQHASLPLSLEAARTLLAPHGLEPVGLQVLTEGKANTNVKLELSDGRPAVLRLYQREKPAQLLETALLRKFKGEIPVAEVIVADPDAGWILLEFLPGRTLQQAAAEGASDDILSAAHGIGAALATIEAVQFTRPGFLDASLTIVDPWPSVIDGLQGYLDTCLARPLLAQRVGDDIVRSVHRAWDEARPSLEAITAKPNLSHADFKPSNLLIHEGRLSGVLDWEFAHSGTWLLDAGQVLRHRGELPEDFPSEVARGLQEGGLDIPDGWQKWAGVIDLMSLVDFLGRDVCSDGTVRHIGRLIHGTLFVPT